MVTASLQSFPSDAGQNIILSRAPDMTHNTAMTWKRDATTMCSSFINVSRVGSLLTTSRYHFLTGRYGVARDCVDSVAIPEDEAPIDSGCSTLEDPIPSGLENRLVCVTL